MTALNHLLSCIVLSILIFNKNISSANNVDINQVLYNAVSNGLYHEAVDITKRIAFTNSKDELKHTVDTLLENNVKNVINFGYKLWEMEDGGQTIVITMFPELFKYLFNEDEVNIYSEEIGVNISAPGGHSGWIFSPVWKHNRVYFKIMNAFPTCYLGFKSEEAYSCSVVQEEPTGDNYMWQVQPVVHCNNSLNDVLIINKIYDALLTTDSNGKIVADPSYLYESRLQLLKVDPIFTVQQHSDELYQAILKSSTTNAINLMNTLHNNRHKLLITYTIQKLLFVRKNNLMIFAVYLWRHGNSIYVQLYFPDIFTHILNEDKISIRKFGSGFTGDEWRFRFKEQLNDMCSIEEANDNSILYSDNQDLMNFDSRIGVGRSSLFHLEPFKYKGNLLFYIVNFVYHVNCKTIDTNGLGYEGFKCKDLYKEPSRYGWILEKGNLTK